MAGVVALGLAALAAAQVPALPVPAAEALPAPDAAGGEAGAVVLPAQPDAPAAAGDEPEPDDTADAPAVGDAGLRADETELTDDALTVGADVAMKAQWNNGLELMTTDREFRVHVGGRAQLDSTAFTAGPGPDLFPADGGLNPPLSGATNFRRGRFRVDGRMYDNYEWLAEYDFINQLTTLAQADPTAESGVGPITAPTEVWLTITELPLVGNVRIGNQNTMNGLEHITSDRWLNFMERSFLNDAFFSPFNNGYAPGILLFDNALEDDRMWWGIGIFKNDQNPFGFANTASANSLQARLTGLVVDDPANAHWRHLGVCAIYQETPKIQNRGAPGTPLPFNAGDLRFRVRGNIRNGPPGPLNSIYADTGIARADYQSLLTLEYAESIGPWQLQAEWAASFVPSLITQRGPSSNAGQQPFGANLRNVFFQGAYCEVMYALTGETRSYNKKQAVLDRYVPRSNFFRVRSPRGIAMSEGAWQIGARYDWICLDDKGLNGGVLNGVTAGLNWIMNPNARVYFNYDFTYRDFTNSFGNRGSGGVNGFGTRMAFDF